MRVFLTGASGFVGRAIAARLILHGYEVVCLAHRSRLPVACNAVVRARLGEDGAIEGILNCSPPCDAIIHAAAFINYDDSAADVVKTNCYGIQQMLAVSRAWRPTSFINISGITVIGKPSQHPITEQHTIDPKNTYHASKLFAEHLVAVACSSTTPTASLRITAPVGHGVPSGRIISVFANNAVAGLPLRLAGRGTRKQNYVDVRDVADGVIACLARRPTGVFNIGGRGTVSNRELAEACIRVLNSKSRIEGTGTADAADDEIWDVSNDAALAAFGYCPCHDIESSINATVQPYASSYN